MGHREIKSVSTDWHKTFFDGRSVYNKKSKRFLIEIIPIYDHNTTTAAPKKLSNSFKDCKCIDL